MWTLWVALSAHIAIALGTASPVSIFSATYVGAPVSTTHVITGAISGVGAAKRISAVRWNVTFRIVWAWGLTIPAAGATAALAFLLVTRWLVP